MKLTKEEIEVIKREADNFYKPSIDEIVKLCDMALSSLTPASEGWRPMNEVEPNVDVIVLKDNGEVVNDTFYYKPIGPTTVGYIGWLPKPPAPTEKESKDAE